MNPSIYWNLAPYIYGMRTWSVDMSVYGIPDSKVHGANMGPTWVLSAPDGPHVGPMNLAIREAIRYYNKSQST